MFCHATAQPKPRLGLADRPASSNPPQTAPMREATSISHTNAPASVLELPSAQPASPSSMYLPMDAEPSHSQSQSATHSLQPPVNATPAAAGDPASHEASIAQPAAGSQSQAASAEASPKDKSANTSVAASLSGDDKPPPAGFDRQIHVFTREAIAAAEANNRYTFWPWTLLNLMRPVTAEQHIPSCPARISCFLYMIVPHGLCTNRILC